VPAANASDSALQKITAFIPSDVLSFYISAVGISTQFSPTIWTKWLFFLGGAVLIPIFIVLSYLESRKKALPVPDKKILLLLLFFSFVAYAVWCAALPASPFLLISQYANIVAGVLVIPLAAIMYKIADLLDAVPKAT
jgi:membrane-associated phospholipid phosphatase